MTKPEAILERSRQTHSSGERESGVRAVRAEHFGFALSLVGVVGVCVAGWSSVAEVGAWMALFSVPGLIVSVRCRFKQARRLSAWGAALGILGTLYVPTMLRALFLTKSG